MNMQELKSRAIKLESGMEKYWPQFGHEEAIVLDSLSPESHIKQYSLNNSVIAFVDTDGGFYVIPDLKGVQRTLRNAGFAKAYFYVPFSNWDYPVDERTKKKWDDLWNAKNSRA